MRKVAGALLLLVSLLFIASGAHSLLGLDILPVHPGRLDAIILILLGVIILLALRFGHLRAKLSKGKLEIEVKEVKELRKLPGYDDIEEIDIEER